jgi:hypothetical protein
MITETRQSRTRLLYYEQHRRHQHRRRRRHHTLDNATLDQFKFICIPLHTDEVIIDHILLPIRIFSIELPFSLTLVLTTSLLVCSPNTRTMPCNASSTRAHKISLVTIQRSQSIRLLLLLLLLFE